MVSDLRYARSAAMFKNCPVRVVFCNDRDCNSRSVSAINSASGNFLGSGSTPARFYAMIRESQRADSSGATPCYNSAASTADGWTYWDFDRRPQSIPTGVVFSPIYTNLAATTADWAVTTDALAANSIYFSQSAGQLNVPVTNGTATNGDTITFQLSLQSCNPNSSSADCLAYLITVGAGGAVNMVKCSPGGRSADGTDKCY